MEEVQKILKSQALDLSGTVFEMWACRAHSGIMQLVVEVGAVEEREEIGGVWLVGSVEEARDGRRQRAERADRREVFGAERGGCRE